MAAHISRLACYSISDSSSSPRLHEGRPQSSRQNQRAKRPGHQRHESQPPTPTPPHTFPVPILGFVQAYELARRRSGDTATSVAPHLERLAAVYIQQDQVAAHAMLLIFCDRYATHL